MQKAQNLMPQEIEVWYLLPSLRREIAKILVNDYHFSQRKVAEVFGMTESAISQYLKDKRASELKFDESELAEIKKTSKDISENPGNYSKLLFELSTKLRGTKSLCDLHRKQDPSIAKNCDMCRR